MNEEQLYEIAKEARKSTFFIRTYGIERIAELWRSDKNRGWCYSWLSPTEKQMVKDYLTKSADEGNLAL